MGERRREPARVPELCFYDRTRRIRQLEAHILALEHQEEGLVTAGLAQGLEVHRRPFAYPLALLGLEPIPPMVAAPEPMPARRRINRTEGAANAQAAE